jgi:alpha-glucosidase (family GH31 glycosyl hydrolase)
LPSTVYSSVSIGFSGFPFISTDIGGFERRPGTDTSWVRWAQFGAMLPGMQTLNMPWWFSKKASDHYRYLSWLHTDMVPYWMSLAHQAHQTGVPICRPLVWSYQHNEKVWKINDQFTVGEYLMMAPVITAGNKRQVYLPKGNWYNFHTNELITGGHEFTWTGDLYHFPLYVKEGAIIPMEIQNDVSGFGTVHSKDYITIAHWPMQKKGSSNFILHDKEQAVTIESSTTAHQLQLNWSHSKFNYLFRIHWSKAKPPRTINTNSDHALPSFGSLKVFEESSVDGWFYDQSTRKLWIRRKVNTDRTLNVLY